MIKFLDLQKINASYEPALSETAMACIESGWYLLGNSVKTFEKAFADFVGVRECVGVANGLDALTLILMALKELHHWDDGDEVIVPAYTFIASAQAVNRAGLIPIFCDVKENDCLMDMEDASQRITPKTRALLPVHLFGKYCDVSPIKKLLEAKNILIVEDAAQAHGASKDGIIAGTQGVGAAFSFYPGKNLGALGDGGAVVTNSQSLAALVRVFANYGATQKYHHDYLGLNSRLDEMQAAILHIKLQYLQRDNQQRARAAAHYLTNLRNLDLKMLDFSPNELPVWHIFPIFTPQRDELQQYLSEKGIETLIHYPIPLHKQHAYKAYSTQCFPIAERMASWELSLPISPIITSEDVVEVSASINDFFNA